MYVRASIEPHKTLLKKPPKNSSLFKIICSEYIFDMIEHNYLFFNGVDNYTDDKRDSDQPNHDKELCKGIGFEKENFYTCELL